ncbi:hypothetical protein MPSEU_000973900 [Mayamaea pseudoterrestris]|nr:hypothetical protein MPSEU_000973900 [Mayamaea pseudoterrestris]
MEFLYNVTIAKPENHLSPEKHQPIIPNIVTFTHYLNLIEVNFTREATLNKTFIADDELDELVVLQQNVRNIIALHPTAKVRFLTDDDCRRSIANVFEQIGKKRDTNATTTSSQLSLVDYFDKERAGMYKADLCRGAALWETGGLYFDVDLGVRMNVLTALQQTQNKRKQATTFCTVRVHEQSNRPGAFFQAFIGVTPQHAIIERYVELFWDYYRGMLPEYKNEPLGVVLLKQAMDDVLRHDPEAAATIELWQEVLYRTNMKSKLEKIVPYPPWGTRRACKFIVVSSAKNPFTVPFYSRIAGSRMCPVGSVTKVAAMKRHRKR